MKRFSTRKIQNLPNKLLPLRKRLNRYQRLNRADKIMGRVLVRHMRQQEVENNI
jgi:hypothetical protein